MPASPPAAGTWGQEPGGPQNASELFARERGRVILRMEELEAAAAGLAMEPELDGAAAAAPVDISTTAASELDVISTMKVSPNCPTPARACRMR